MRGGGGWTIPFVAAGAGHLGLVIHMCYSRSGFMEREAVYLRIHVIACRLVSADCDARR